MDQMSKHNITQSFALRKAKAFFCVLLYFRQKVVQTMPRSIFNDDAALVLNKTRWSKKNLMLR